MKASAQFIFITVFLDALGIGLLIPVLPDVIRRFSADPNTVSHLYGYFGAVYALMQFFASPVLGSLSDRFGRRPVLLISLLFAAIDYLVMAFAPSLFVLFIGRVISGLTGATVTVASSYMADISNDKNRAANFGLIGAAFGFGFIVGPGLGGLLGSYGAMVPFMVAALLNFLNFLFGIFILPESLPAESRRSFNWKQLNPFVSLIKIFSTPSIVPLVWVYAFVFLAGNSHPSIWTLYTQHKFGWDTFAVGISLTAAGLTIAISQGYLTRILAPKWGEFRMVKIGLIFSIIDYLVYGFITQGWMVYVAIWLNILVSITIPALQSLISKDAPPETQGELQGSLMALSSLTAVIAPILYTDLFARFSDVEALGMELSGMPYLVATIFCSVSLWIFLKRKPASH